MDFLTWRIPRYMVIVLCVTFSVTTSWRRINRRHTWWRHQVKTSSALLAICAGNAPVTGEFPAQRPVTRSFDVFFDLRLNKRWSKQSWGWWFEMPSGSLWRRFNGSTQRMARAGYYYKTHRYRDVITACWDRWIEPFYLYRHKWLYTY